MSRILVNVIKGLDCSGAIWEQVEQAEDFIRNDLSDPVEKGLIKRVGRGRGSYYTPKI